MRLNYCYFIPNRLSNFPPRQTLRQGPVASSSLGKGMCQLPVGPLLLVKSQTPQFHKTLSLNLSCAAFPPSQAPNLPHDVPKHRCGAELCLPSPPVRRWARSHQHTPKMAGLVAALPHVLPPGLLPGEHTRPDPEVTVVWLPGSKGPRR